MMLVEKAPIPAEALPVPAFRDHLRLGSGFADDGLQDGLLEMHLRAALAAIEGRTGKILIARSFVWTVSGWRDFGRQALPVAPIRRVTELRLIDRSGAVQVVDGARYRLEPDGQRPRIVSQGLHLPLIPMGGSAEIEFEAGYGDAWDDLPADLGQAVLVLAAHFYERRGGGVGEDGIPFPVSLLIDRYRTVRLFGEGAR